MRSPIVYKPARDNAAGAHFPHGTNYADERVLASSTGFLKGTNSGYCDERLLPGSNILRHKLPSVKLRRSSSTPASRQDESTILIELKSDAYTFGGKGCRVASSVRTSISREKVARALAEGNMPALRAAVRGAVWGAKLQSDPSVRQAQQIIRKYDACVRECRDALIVGDMICLQMAMDDLEKLKLMSVGPALMDDPTLQEARAALSQWAPFKPYLFKLENSWYEGPRQYALYWLVLVEGNLLNSELEAKATADLASLGQPGEEALEAALARPELRFHYRAPWSQRNILLQQVRASIVRLGFDVGDLRIRVARDRANDDAELTSVVVAGPQPLLDQIRESAERFDGEPRAGVSGEHSALIDTSEQRKLRADGHRAMLKSDTLEATSLIPRSRSSGSERSELTRRSPWYESRQFTKTF